MKKVTEKEWKRMCVKFKKKTTRKEFSASPRFWAWASWMKIRRQRQNQANHHPCCPTASYVSKWLKQPTEQWENSPQKRPNLDPVGQGIANWVSPHNGPAGKPCSGSSFQHSQKQTGVSPLLRKQAHVSGTDISDRGGNFFSRRQLTNDNRNKTRTREHLTRLLH